MAKKPTVKPVLITLSPEILQAMHLFKMQRGNRTMNRSKLIETALWDYEPVRRVARAHDIRICPDRRSPGNPWDSQENATRKKGKFVKLKNPKTN